IPSCARSSKTFQLSSPNTRTGAPPSARGRARSSCVRSRSSTDLPAPFGPRTAVWTPSGMVSDSPWRTALSPFLTVALFSSRTGGRINRTLWSIVDGQRSMVDSRRSIVDGRSPLVRLLRAGARDERSRVEVHRVPYVPFRESSERGVRALLVAGLAVNFDRLPLAGEILL